jgi:ATP-dependent 26S proteasome regulatory subunit
VSELRRILRVAGAADASQKARRAGATPPRNVLLAGPPGTGKTLIARAAAAQLDAPLLVASAAEIVKGKYAGVGVERVRTLFAAARRVAARSTGRLAVVFIDELDSCYDPFLLVSYRTLAPGAARLLNAVDESQPQR